MKSLFLDEERDEAIQKGHLVGRQGTRNRPGLYYLGKSRNRRKGEIGRTNRKIQDMILVTVKESRLNAKMSNI